MRILTIGDGPIHQALFPDGPRVQALLGGSGESELAAAQVRIPPGGSMPEHSHGDSEALVIPVAGELVISDAEQEHVLSVGEIVYVPRGDRVRLENRGDQPASMIAVFTPPAFIKTFDDWPTI